MSMVSVGEYGKQLADKKVKYAIDKFAECLKTGVWDGYPVGRCEAEMPAWMEEQWSKKEVSARREAMTDARWSACVAHRRERLACSTRW